MRVREGNCDDGGTGQRQVDSERGGRGREPRKSLEAERGKGQSFSCSLQEEPALLTPSYGDF